MDGVSSPAGDEQTLVSLFLEIAVGQTPDIARQFLLATNWKLEEAIQLFYIGNEGGAAISSPQPPHLESDVHLPDPILSEPINELEDENARQGDGYDVRPPLPVIRDVLYDNTMFYGGSRMGGSSHAARSVVPFRNFEEEMKRPGIWETEHASAPPVDNSRDNLASLYRPPFALMFHGPFEKLLLLPLLPIKCGSASASVISGLSATDYKDTAKDAAKLQNKWLLVNLQSTREFSSHMLNRDTWANEAVAQTIKSNFIFWQVYDDTEEGSKVCTYYKLESIPVVLLIDPVTGQKMRSWRGMVQPENLLEDLLPYMDDNPTNHCATLSHKRPRESSQGPYRAQDENEEDEELLQALAASMEGVGDGVEAGRKETDDAKEMEACVPEKPTYPPLPEEPNVDRTLLCRVGVRLPDGRRIQRNFLRSDPIQLLWSFCCSKLEEAKTRPFRLTDAIPGSYKCLDYGSNLTFEDSGLANSMISFTWE